MKRKFGARLYSVIAVLLVGGTIAMFVPFTGCSSLHLGGKIDEGVITYEVTYPYYDGFMTGMLPDEMQMHFKDNRYTSELSSGNYFRTSFNSNCNQKTLEHELKFMNSQFVSRLDEEEIPDLVGQFPSFTIIETNESDSVAGFLCKRAIAVFDAPDLPDMNLYYTDEIEIDDFNWCTQFNELDGVLLAYETEQFGLRTRFRAVSVETIKVEEETFSPNPDYEEITGAEMHLKMQDIFNDVIH